MIEYKQVWVKSCGCSYWVSTKEVLALDEKSRERIAQYQKTVVCPEHEFVTVLQNRGANSVR